MRICGGITAYQQHTQRGALASQHAAGTMIKWDAACGNDRLDSSLPPTRPDALDPAVIELVECIFEGDGRAGHLGESRRKDARLTWLLIDTAVVV